MPDLYSRHLDLLDRENRLRTIPASRPEGLIDLTGNDYLGIAASGVQERLFMSDVVRRNDAPPLTSAASRLLAGRQREYQELEQELGEAYGKEALLFNSGYHANTGCISALAASGALIVCDKLGHASIIDGLRLSGSDFLRFRHNDMAHLRRLLDKHAADYEVVWIVVESIYSMDGDCAPLRELVALKQQYPSMRLYVDEAHGLGAFGPTGLGVCEALGLLPQIDLLIGTFGKALASSGAFAVTSPELRAYLLNTARSFIFSTALPPLNVAYSLHTLRAARTMQREREHLHRLSRLLNRGLTQITNQPTQSSSQIVPWMAGSSVLAIERAKALRERGFMAMPIRRPTVAAGTERIRFSLSAALTETHIHQLLEAISSILRNDS